MSATLVDRMVQAVFGRALSRPTRHPRCVRCEVRSESEIRAVAAQLKPVSVSGASVLPSLLRDLVGLNTPALFLNIVDSSGPVHVVLRPWEGRSIRMRGSSYVVEAGSEAPEGIEAFTSSPQSHVTALFPTAPDHPVYVMSVEQQQERVYDGVFPPYLTHVTIMVNGAIVTHCERLLHERGAHVWRAA